LSWCKPFRREISFGRSPDYRLASRINLKPTKKNQSVAKRAFPMIAGYQPVNETIPRTPMIKPRYAKIRPNCDFNMRMPIKRTPIERIVIA
jgi:hypothetical protein